MCVCVCKSECVLSPTAPALVRNLLFSQNHTVMQHVNHQHVTPPTLHTHPSHTMCVFPSVCAHVLDLNQHFEDILSGPLVSSVLTNTGSSGPSVCGATDQQVAADLFLACHRTS